MVRYLYIYIAFIDIFGGHKLSHFRKNRSHQLAGAHESAAFDPRCYHLECSNQCFGISIRVAPGTSCAPRHVRAPCDA